MGAWAGFRVLKPTCVGVSMNGTDKGAGHFKHDPLLFDGDSEPDSDSDFFIDQEKTFCLLLWVQKKRTEPSFSSQAM